MRPTDAELYQLAEQTGQALSGCGMMLASAESCTGGWVGMLVTAVPGSSAWYERGFITYTNAAKHDMLGVQTATLQASGAVSEATVLEMAQGALARSRAQIALAISGIAGPDPRASSTGSLAGARGRSASSLTAGSGANGAKPPVVVTYRPGRY